MGVERVAERVFVLNGGGNLGAVQVGMLQALLEGGIRPDAVVGTSIGALNAAFLAGHADLAGIEELSLLWASVRRRDVFPMSIPALAKGVFGHRPFIVESLGLRSLLMRANFGFERLEEAPIPVRVVATDLDTGDAVVLRSGDTIRALLASSAIPGVFPTVEIGGRTLIDGGIAANTPIAQAEAFEPSEIYVLPTLPAAHLPPPGNAILMMQRAMALAAHPGEQRAIAEASSRRSVRILPVPAAAGKLSIFDFRATRQLIRESYVLAASWLEGGASSPIVGELQPVSATGASLATA
jgi:NTE family protein